MISIKDVKIINYMGFVEDGMLVPVEDTPFEIARVFYVSSVESKKPRGKHAHRKTRQILICLNGSIECLCEDSQGNSASFTLDDPARGLYIPEMIWDEQVYNSKDSILLSLCSTKYDKNDYITNWKDFINVNS